MTDQEIVRKLAELMGWRVVEDSDPLMFMDGSGPIAKYYTIELTSFYQFSPLTNLNHIWMVVERMRELGFNFNFNWQAHPGITISIAQFHKLDPFIHGQGANDNPCRAIAEAAIKAWEAKGQNAELTRWAAEEMGLDIQRFGRFDPTYDSNHRDHFLNYLIYSGHRVEMAAPIGDAHLFAYLVDGCEYCDANQGRALILAARKCKGKENHGLR